MKNYRILLFLFSIALINLLGCESDSTPTLPEIEVAEIQTHLSTLASDAFMGRKPMTEGETKTIQYLENAFKEMGIAPGNGDSYFQEVPLINITGTPGNEMLVSGGKKPMTLGLGSDFVTFTEREQDEVAINQSELVFCGYGIVAPEYEWNDYEGIDMKGKTAVVLVNDPGFGTEDNSFFKGNTMTYYGRWTYKYEEGARQGAAAVLVSARLSIGLGRSDDRSLDFLWPLSRNSRISQVGPRSPGEGGARGFSPRR